MSLLLGAVVALPLCLSAAALLAGPREVRDWCLDTVDRWHIAGPRAAWYWKARRLEEADPVRDARAAFREHRYDLLAAGTIGIAVPGPPDDIAGRMTEARQVDVLYAGCVTTSEEEDRYRDAVDEYAEPYNVEMLRLIKQAGLPDGPLQPTGTPEPGRE